MKNMKKLWALLLALAMTFSLAACGGSTTEEDTADDQTTEDTATDDTAAESDLAYVQDKGTLVVGITRTPTATGSALTRTWPLNLPRAWASPWSFR